MAWMSDEAWEFVSDSRDKKVTARSARSTRTHCGKRGAVKFPSDYKTAKELKAMNGECIKYASLKKPMTWEEFKALPDDLKIEYIKGLREKFNVPDKEIGNMFGIQSGSTLYRWLKTLGLTKGMGSGPKTITWNKEGWLAWLHGADTNAVTPSATEVKEEAVEEMTVDNTDEAPVETDNEAEASDILEELSHGITELVSKDSGTINIPFIPDTVQNGTICACEKKCIVPTTGEMTFNGNINDILSRIALLLNDANVCLEVKWMTIEE